MTSIFSRNNAWETNMNTPDRVMVAFLLALATGLAVAGDGGFTRKFPLGSCQFTSVGGSPYFPVIPGRQTYFSNSACVAAGKCEELTELWITMERDTRRITLPVGQKTRNIVTRVME